jgi:hypothetical protein
MLAPLEREAVLGDLAEASECGWRGLAAVLGLWLRRQAMLWKNWRPWLAAFGLAVPGTFLLIGFSLSVSQAYEAWINPGLQRATGFTLGPGFLLLICNVALLLGWAWTGGYVASALSRRTLWVSAILSFLPCAFCLERFRIPDLSRLSLLLFLPPAIWGVWRGLQVVRIRLRSAIVLAAALTALTIPMWHQHGTWIPNWALSWPAWYVVATASRRSLTREQQDVC